MGKKVLWGTRFGFYLAAVGSAFGLGNLWRFPYVAVENGGGVFVVLYIFLAVVIGLPLLISELMLGKLTRKRSIIALPGPGKISLAICMLILAYYAVVSGWVLHFLAQFTVGHLVSGRFDVERSLLVLRENADLQILLTSAHLLITTIVILKGVQQGIERWIGNLMPFFLFLLVILVTKSLSLPTAGEALRFLFYPDFSKLHWGSLLSALGHVLFTLSVGFGTMVTFGSYLNDETHIPSAGFRVVALDTLISLFAGLLIFPLMMEQATEHGSPEMLFRTLPRLLSDLDSGAPFGIVFFLSLYIAALGATIGMLESVVANVMDVSKVSRAKASWLVALVTLGLSILPILAHSTFQNSLILGRSPLYVLDYIFVNVFLPISAVVTCIGVAMHLKRDQVRAEFVNDDTLETQKLFSHWEASVKYIVPGMVLLAFLLAIIGFFKNKL